MPVTKLGISVFDAALARLKDVYQEGHRVVVSFSGGKDSTAVLELAIIAARETNRLPVEVVMRDDEIMFPGTFEYAERVAQREEVLFDWICARQPVLNVFYREKPFWTPFDPRVEDRWVRQPPEYATQLGLLKMTQLVNDWLFVPPPGKMLVAVTGIRAEESSIRRASIHGSGGPLTKNMRGGAYTLRPIYDWKTGDVWKAIRDHGWDHNSAYTTLLRMGVRPFHLRLAPPTASLHSLNALRAAAKAWPQWFDRVCNRLSGIRLAALYGARAVMPQRQLGETWEQTFHRVCVDTAPDWIRERALKVRDYYMRRHAKHAITPFPQKRLCLDCGNGLGSWRRITMLMWNGNPYTTHVDGLLPHLTAEQIEALQEATVKGLRY